jgi:hypothetical protein
MKSILILSTCYDSNSAYTAAWARALHDDLVKQQNVSCFLYEAQYLCRSGPALADAVERSDFVVFYGHGMQDRWIALPELPGSSPSVAAIPVVDTSSTAVLQGRKVYAGCCWSLNGLGRDYIAKFPDGEYVGYSHELGFEAANETYFRDVVNQSVIGFVHGDPANTVASNLRAEWTSLHTKFFSGSLKTKRNAPMAAKMADLNSQRIGSRP